MSLWSGGATAAEKRLTQARESFAPVAMEPLAAYIPPYALSDETRNCHIPLIEKAAFTS
jgi:hypothetical protein